MYSYFLTKGTAIKMHLDTIGPLLKSWNDHHSLQMSMQEPGDNSEECDEDVEAVCKSVKKADSPAESYLNWLRLLISHFDAISILIRYITGLEFQYEAISINIVVPPPVVPVLLLWQTLFSNATLFPTAPSLDSYFDVNYLTTNANILDFVNCTLKALPWFKDAQEAWENGDKDVTIKCFQDLRTSKMKSWVKWAEKMLAKLNSNNSLYVWSTEIAMEIQSACESTAFFTALAKDEGILGMLHCEAFWACCIVRHVWQVFSLGPHLPAKTYWHR